MHQNTYISHAKKTLTLAFPIMFGHLGHVMTHLADSAMIGQVHSNSLAAASLANGLFVIMLTLGLGISFGLTPLVAVADGNNNTEEKTRLLKNGFIVNLLAGLGLFVLILGVIPLLGYMKQPEQVVVLAKPYLLIIACSMIPLMIFQHFKQFAEGLSKTKVAMYISLLSNIINIVLNYVLIFGKFGFPRLELVGAGIATLISRIVMAYMMYAYIKKGKEYKIYGQGFSMKGTSRSHMKEIWLLGFPIGIQFMFEAGSFVVASIMIGWIGAKQLAAHQIALSLASLTYMTASGISAATTVRVGNYFGSGNISELKKAGFTSLVMAMVFMMICAVGFVLSYKILPPIFTPEIDVQQVASGLIIIAAFFQVSDGLQVVALGILRGMKDVRMPTYIAIIAYWVAGLPAGYFFAFVLGWKEKGIWWGYVVGLSVAALLLITRILMKTKLRQQKA